MTALAPNATIGILGNGQLGRMLCLAAARLGYRTHVYGPEADSPAEQVATETTVAAYDDEAALAAFAKAVNVITFEFENVPAPALAFLTALTTVRPSAHVLEVSQDRLKEKPSSLRSAQEQRRGNLLKAAPTSQRRSARSRRRPC